MIINLSMYIKEFCRKSVAAVIQTTSRLLVAVHFVRPKVVVHVDGGICSQMTQWLIGQYYTEGGFDVYYDLEWYRRWGRGLDGKIEMPFELSEMCPNISVRQLSARRTNFYRMFMRITEYENNKCPARLAIKHSIYITRYPAIPDTKWLTERFNYFFNVKNIATVSDEKFPRKDGVLMCAVHVRRGDLAKLTIPGLYVVTPTQYFLDTIEYVADKYKNVRFCFFSDELDFIETDILPLLNLPRTCDYVMMRGNRAYEDLVLVARCDMISGSQGTASRHGAKMNSHAGLILLKVKDDTVVGYEIIREPQSDNR